MFPDWAAQVIGGFCALIGVFILALPVPIVVNRYSAECREELDV